MSDESKTSIDYTLIADLGTFKKLYEIVDKSKIDNSEFFIKIQELVDSGLLQTKKR